MFITLLAQISKSGLSYAAKRDKQEAEGKAAHASHELQQQQQESQTRWEELQQRSSAQLQDAKDSSSEKMEGYCNNFRWSRPPDCQSGR